MKVIKYELTVVWEDSDWTEELDKTLARSDIMNTEMSSYDLKTIYEEDFEFKERTEEGEETGSWYEDWFLRAGELLSHGDRT
jgi:hypothetical protein